MLVTIEVETKHLVNKWATINKDVKAYTQNRETTKRGAAAIPEPKYFDLFMDAVGAAVDVNEPAEHHDLDFIQSDLLTIPLYKIKVCRAGAVALDERVFGVDKESEVEQEDRNNHTTKDNDEDGDPHIPHQTLTSPPIMIQIQQMKVFQKPLNNEDSSARLWLMTLIWTSEQSRTSLSSLSRLSPRERLQSRRATGRSSQAPRGQQGPGQDRANEDAARPRAR
ncbi:hypothetical protein BDK51DRAFT_49386 [Blyttiomyces helicus]|uniref:Uncharacterized protein n=1 Tax=Blyttiomyces helicus TaxID=388810 RepID=A0A4P9W4D4_9FUNG|nr:hypothetical protein BDK51DRAFT_49386 [Blyttiomyces helicus]|eukprot:RKO86752.1 hypothetical protein BDK51DRAFT_49386 [Blyttiomyces helicus]